MPRCKHKMYCVFCFFFYGGGSQLIANQTGDGQVGFVSMSSVCSVQGGHEGKKNDVETTSPEVQHCCKRQKRSKYPFRLSH